MNNEYNKMLQHITPLFSTMFTTLDVIRDDFQVHVSTQLWFV